MIPAETLLTGLLFKHFAVENFSSALYKEKMGGTESTWYGKQATRKSVLFIPVFVLFHDSKKLLTYPRDITHSKSGNMIK